MKPILITSAVSIALGFAGGWIIKSASQDLQSVSKQQTVPTERPAPRPTSNPNPDPSFPMLPEVRPNSEAEAIAFTKATIPESAQQADRAKWLRLSEVLGLDADQTKALAANIEESSPKPSLDEPIDITYEKAGEDLEKRILAILTPDQQVEFKKLQQRSLENMVELKAQKNFSDNLGNLDLTPAQREQTLDVLRENAKSELSEISPSTRLALSGSFLPHGNERLTDDAILFTKKIKSSGNNPTMEDVAAIHRIEIEERLQLFEGILTPGQLESYRASLGKSLVNLNLISPP